MKDSTLYYIRKKFYQYRTHSTGFENINENTIEDLKSKLEYWDERIFSKIKPGYLETENYARYVAVLSFVSDSKSFATLGTFDERALFLMLAVDPEFKAYQIYVQSNILRTQDVDKINDKKIQTALLSRRKRQLEEMQRKVRDELGFYDSEFLLLECKYCKKWNNKKTLIYNVKKDYFKTLVKMMADIPNFDEVSLEDLHSIQEKIDKYNKILTQDVDKKTIIYHILYQSDVLGLESDIEKVMFAILALDKELQMLQIYEEENKWYDIAMRSYKELGFFNREFVFTERKFHDKLMPEKIIDWSKKQELKN